jgi:putative Mg2+ transporter-C (MgtC) family protein
MLEVEWISHSTLTEIVLLAMAFVLSAVIGVERQRRLKSAGLRTHTLVGLGAAVFTLVSAYGFKAMIGNDVILDPSRIAAQIVSGIGFLGAGVIFVRQNAVAGLTTAASIWVTAAVGMACGAGMPILAAAATGLHLCAVGVLGLVAKYVRPTQQEKAVVLQYTEGYGALRTILAASTDMGFEALVTDTRKVERPGSETRVHATLRFRSANGSPESLMERFADVPGVISARVEERYAD